MLLTPTGRFDCFIQFCPWCGKRTGKEAQDLVCSGFDPFD